MNKAVVVFLVTESCVNRLIEPGKGVKGNMVQVSPLSAPATRVIASNVPPFIKNEVLPKELPLFGEFASDMKMIPLGCKTLQRNIDIGHKQFDCPHRAAQQVRIETDQADTREGHQGKSSRGEVATTSSGVSGGPVPVSAATEEKATAHTAGLTNKSPGGDVSAAGSNGNDLHKELIPSDAAEAKAKAKTDRPVREDDESVIEHQGVIDSSAHEEHVGELEGGESDSEVESLLSDCLGCLRYRPAALVSQNCQHRPMSLLCLLDCLGRPVMCIP
ncbi:hypothetical protein SRHO_G00131050 [Serrasalmus rhombeus]